ncbi:exported hypothetical protein [Cupriavidus taiwanensis]|uniref:Uncharacterized protein n=1 Tax=Cupriavidus taiwanensis TaxID=164546 RepID=A0A375CQ02_9BURK|nr:hypothetical protein [Cupriavidus taiwanensis]SOY77494.1 exported hypothetical protein [Cupriavidus taiwanensis]
MLKLVLLSVAVAAVAAAILSNQPSALPIADGVGQRCAGVRLP